MVGDGFDVVSPMPGSRIRQLSPFLLIDHTGPMDVKSTENPLGADPHPHRGFETVTIVYQGFLAHRDTAGYSGKIGPGDVQWMTAGSGLLHEERHEKEFSKQGGILELVQLWVNVPQKDKMAKPRYQELPAPVIPIIEKKDGKGSIRVISGSYENTEGPAQTFSPITILDVKQEAGGSTELKLPADYNVGLYMVKGAITVNGRQAKDKQLVVFGWNAENISVSCSEDAAYLILAGEPIEEPLATYGPFVMNSNKELIEAMEDFASGKMGKFND
ncbi:pirin family protein [Mucilaginibacter sp. HMF7410]|uniref:Pirin family protein n=2 Tax=Mucilaginibacter arboris TaxID=2682090 RepID=A0A7K1T191_9SPHI|nr:pirin family protein [Mucilaginibacter arboris]